MRRVKRSKLTAFFYGLCLATAGTVGAIGVLYAVSPPSPDIETSGLAKVASAPHETRTDALPANARVSEADDLSAAQSRVARQMADMDAQRVLTRSIQQELQRVGCFPGSIDGQWSETTRRSMAAFTQSLNVKLPLNAPDYILLTMLQGQRGVACGPVKSNELPSVTARAGEKTRVRERTTTERIETSSLPAANTAVTTPPEKWPEAKVAVQEQAKREVMPEFRTSVVTATDPSASQSFQPVIIQPSVAQPMPPLPGRMAVGAPVHEANPSAPEPLAVAVPPPAAAKKTRPVTREAQRSREFRDYRPSPVVIYTPPSQPRRANMGSQSGPFAALSRNAP